MWRAFLFTSRGVVNARASTLVLRAESRRVLSQPDRVLGTATGTSATTSRVKSSGPVHPPPRPSPEPPGSEELMRVLGGSLGGVLRETAPSSALSSGHPSTLSAAGAMGNGAQGHHSPLHHHHYHYQDQHPSRSSIPDSSTPPPPRPPVTETEPDGSARAPTEMVLPPGMLYPLRAYYVANSLDVVGIRSVLFAGAHAAVARDSVIVKFPPTPPELQVGESTEDVYQEGVPLAAAGDVDVESEEDSDPDNASYDQASRWGTKTSATAVGASFTPPAARYLVAFSYGAVVFFGFRPLDQAALLKELTQYGRGKVYDDPNSEDFSLVIKPGMSPWSMLRSDTVYLKRLDANSLRVIGGVLGQTVALDHYEKKVDELLETFSSLNSQVTKDGRMDLKREALFQLVAENNSILTEVIRKLGLLERSDTAWKYATYSKIWEDLREEFELESRFKTVDIKLSLVHHNTKFFLEVLHNDKSNKLEWTIIVLIFGEIVVMVYELATRVPNL